MGIFMHAAEGDMVIKSTNEKVRKNKYTPYNYSKKKFKVYYDII